MCVYSVQIKSIHDLNQFLENKRRMNNRRLFFNKFCENQVIQPLDCPDYEFLFGFN